MIKLSYLCCRSLLGRNTVSSGDRRSICRRVSPDSSESTWLADDPFFAPEGNMKVMNEGRELCLESSNVKEWT